MRNAVYRPLGVSCPSWPVDVGQTHRRLPSTATIMRWVDLSIVTRTAAPAGAAGAARNTARAIRARQEMSIKPGPRMWRNRERHSVKALAGIGVRQGRL